MEGIGKKHIREAAEDVLEGKKWTQVVERGDEIALEKKNTAFKAVIKGNLSTTEKKDRKRLTKQKHKK